MIDTMTEKPLHVETHEATWPYLKLPASQLAEVQQLLKRHAIEHWVADHRFSWDGGPYVATINFVRGADPKTIQAILDSVP
jgi:hypothetical protein